MIGILEMAKRIKDEDRELESKNHSPLEPLVLKDKPDDSSMTSSGDFNLSKKIIEDSDGYLDKEGDMQFEPKDWFFAEDVKEFIRIYIGIINRQQGDLSKIKLIRSLRKLAGRKLT